MEASEYKFNEQQLIEQLQRYVNETYGGYYAGSKGVQALDIIEASGHGMGFCLGSILKYASRYGKKDGYNRKDLMKILHYSLLSLYFHDQEQQAVKVTNTTKGLNYENETQWVGSSSNKSAKLSSINTTTSNASASNGTNASSS